MGNSINVSLTVEGSGLYNGSTGILRGRLWAGEGHKIYCDWLRISIPAGNEPEQLFLADGGTSIELESAVWSRSGDAGSEGGVEELDGMTVLTLSSYGGGQRPLSEPIEFIITGKVNLTAGTAEVKYEYDYKEDDESDFHTGGQSFSFDKMKAALYLQNFMASDAQAGTNATACFAPGVPVYFSWESNGTDYELYAAGHDGAMKLLTQTSQKYFLYQDGIVRDTTFLLKAVKTRNGRMARENTIGPQEEYAALTLTTVSPSFSGITVGEASQKALDNHFICNKAMVHMLGTAIEISVPSDKNYKEITAQTDGILAGYINVIDCAGTSAALLRATVYGDGKQEECSVQDQAYSAKIQTGDGELALQKGASVMLPVAKGKRVVLYWTMTKPQQSTLEKNYNLYLYFHPFGKTEQI